jgi:hypothetical protein
MLTNMTISPVFVSPEISFMYWGAFPKKKFLLERGIFFTGEVSSQQNLDLFLYFRDFHFRFLLSLQKRLVLA